MMKWNGLISESSAHTTREKFRLKIKYLTAASYFLCSTASFAAVTQTQPNVLMSEISITTVPSTSTNSNTSADKKRSVLLVPKWSLPFQGQLGGKPEPTAADMKQAKAPAAKVLAANANATATSAALQSTDLNSLKQKKYAVLTISQPETLQNTLIANADSVGTTANISKNSKFIAGTVSAFDGPFDVDRIVNYLVDTHFENSPEGKKLDEQVKRQNNVLHKTIAATKDTINQTIEYQGIEPSMRAARLITESNDYKIRNNAWAEYVRQKYIDQIHFQVVSGLMEIAEGIGNNETERGAKSIAAGKESLVSLVGEEEASRAVKAMTDWLANMPTAYASFAQTPWTTMERSKKLEEVMKAAVEKDEVITKITKRVYKYGHPSKAFQYSSNVIQTTLDAIALGAPGIIPSVAAGVAEASWKLSTGGTELNKLERELLLDKRIQSRLKVLSQESALAVDSYRYALLTKNPPLMTFSEEVIGNLTTKSDSPKLVSAQSDHHSSNLVPDMKESTGEKITID